MYEKQLKLKCEELEKEIKLINESLLFITHELKTPLSIIEFIIQMIEVNCKDELSDKMGKYLYKIRQNTYRQRRLVNNIMDYNRINPDQYQLYLTRVDIVQLSRLIVESINVYAERKSIEMTFDSTISNLYLLIDIYLYERVLLNLLSNAIKYTPEGKSVDVRIFRQESKGCHNVCIQVKDSGIGIPNDKKELIFERFGQADRFPNRCAEGSGIGLYLVKVLVSIMDGEINVESKVGIGSTFSLILPAIDTDLNMPIMDTKAMEVVKEQFIAAADIEFSDIYYAT